MGTTIIASNIPQTVTEDKVADFFSFCGKIKSIKQIDSTEKVKKYEVQFESEKAISTATLLNDAELDGGVIKVQQVESPPAYTEGTSDASKAAAGDNKVQEDTTKTGDATYDDISQEEKPKYAIMAQLLASGYHVSDSLIDKAIKVDNEKGISTKFKEFLGDLDKKYVHLNEPDSTANKGIAKAQSKWSDLTTSFNKSSYSQKLSSYFEKASNSPYGAKIHDFYSHLAKDVKDVHNEARRLAALKSAEKQSQEQK
ncbi:Piso0_002929 [Millerozyma farinosa CBS 7064]|uniref:Piso0_002929 protein n=1 Tax=Pichia sorbitophila (strain ATCC MYA-4447 / BCRC 22081 / CBS 7064 / NBRC 10061 / NRRL Y-12695) TaxID=559304 RepID=G8YJV8_PICSO|nr:Piso0_002929 [Millerozyma farinosa CBS 7064]CCE80603.1 Piso0_002929 [Millerozyma farinosa CBS 7064]